MTAATVPTTSEATAGPGYPGASDQGSPAAETRARFRLFSSIRARFLGAYVGLLTVATVASVVGAEQLVVYRLDERIERELVQESQELRRLATGIDPATGEPFGDDVRRIFRVYLQRNIPSHDEALLTFVDGKPFLRSRPADPGYRLDRDRELVARWANLEATSQGSADTPAGRLTYLAVPLESRGKTHGVFVVAQFRDAELRELRSALLAIVGVGIVVLVAGSLLAWRLAGKVLGPVREVTGTARSISESDLSARLPVRSQDEVGELSTTFNEMLDRLQRAFASQRRFADDASHELKTPLTIVRGHLELLEDDPAERGETLALVMDELDRMGRIVQDLLLLAKHDQPDFLDLATVEVGGFTDDVHAKVRALAAREWVLESRGRGVIVGDRQRLTQAIVQLAQNAARYSDGAEPIGVGSAVADGEARFWVRDRGPGIPLEEQEHVFERFGRGSGRRHSEGAGLGLAIVKAIAEAHGGRVELESGRGAGAVFTIVVPVDQRDHQEARAR
jgi:signal transduction histidine kinase